MGAMPTLANTRGGRVKTDTRYRAIWISDTHLGTPGCQAGALLDFLDAHECEFLYLVGDIIDFWRLKRSPYWTQLQSDVIRKVLSKARAGTVVTLIPGNHDEYLRRFCDLQLGNIMVTREAVHRMSDGRLLLVVHGDEFDGITACHRWVAVTGDVGYEMLLVFNRWVSRTGACRRTSRARSSAPSTSSRRSRRDWRTRRHGAACRAWCAATSIARRCATSTASSTATPAIGSRAARRSSKAWTGRSS